MSSGAQPLPEQPAQNPNSKDNFVPITLASLVVTIPGDAIGISNDDALKVFYQLLSEQLARNSREDIQFSIAETSVRSGSIIIRLKVIGKFFWHTASAIAVIGGVDHFLDLGLRDNILIAKQIAYESSQQAVSYFSEEVQMQVTYDFTSIPDKALREELRIALRERGYRVIDEDEDSFNPKT